MKTSEETIEELKGLLKILDEQIEDLSRFDSPIYLTRTIEEVLRTAKAAFPQDQAVERYSKDIELAHSELRRLGALGNERSRIFQETFDEWSLRKTDRAHEELITRASLFEKLTVLCAASLGVLVSALGIISAHIALGTHLHAKKLLFAGMISLVLGLFGSLTGNLISLRRSELANALGDIYVEETLLQRSNFHYVSPSDKREEENARLKAEFKMKKEKELNGRRLRWLTVLEIGDGTALAGVVVVAIVIAFSLMALFINVNFGL